MRKKKPGPIARARKAKAAKDARYARKVRALVAERDGYCRRAHDRVSGYGDPCAGVSEWAHFGPWKRFKTRGTSPEMRHCTAGSLMLCTTHHRDYDQGRLTIRATTLEVCDGPLEFEAHD